MSVGDVASGTLTECANFADSSAQVIERITGIRPADKYLALFPSSDTEFQQWTVSTSHDLAGAFVFPQSEGTKGWVTIDLGLSIAPGFRLRDDPSYLEHVIRHELFHANTLSHGDVDVGNAPLWVIEGFAEWAGSTATVVFPQKAPPAILPVENAEFAHDTTTYAYARSFMFVSYLVSRFGQETAIKFYNRCREPANGSTASSFKYVFRSPLTTVEQDWAAQYKKQVAALKVDVVEK